MVDLLLYDGLRETEDEEPALRLGPFDDIDIFRDTIYGDFASGPSFMLLHATTTTEERVNLLQIDEGSIWKADTHGIAHAIRSGLRKTGKFPSDQPVYYLVARVVDAATEKPRSPQAIKRRTIILEKS